MSFLLGTFSSVFRWILNRLWTVQPATSYILVVQDDVFWYQRGGPFYFLGPGSHKPFEAERLSETMNERCCVSLNGICFTCSFEAANTKQTSSQSSGPQSTSLEARLGLRRSDKCCCLRKCYCRHSHMAATFASTLATAHSSCYVANRFAVWA